MKEFEILIPTSLRDIKLSQWQKFKSILDKNEGAEDSDFVKQKMLEIFCGIDLKQASSIPLKTFDDLILHINDLFSDKCDRVNKFKLRGTDGVEVQFGLIPNLDEMSYGEHQDIEKYLFDTKNLHRAMAVLYRPVLFNKGETYHIERYRGSDHLADVMKDCPLDVFFGVQVFFYNLARKLGLYTMDSTLQELLKKEEETLEQPLEKSGETTKQSIHLHREMLQDLIKLQNSMSTNV